MMEGSTLDEISRSILMFMEELEDDARLSANLVTYNSAISCYLAETKRRASS